MYIKIDNLQILELNNNKFNSLKKNYLIKI